VHAVLTLVRIKKVSKIST